jgi:hypothetical protein
MADEDLGRSPYEPDAPDTDADGGPPHVDRLALDAVADYRPREVAGGDRSEWAGVLVPVIERRDGHHLLFTERAADMRTHAGDEFPRRRLRGRRR